MPRSRNLALRAGLYVAVTLSSFAAAYMLKEWLPYLWEARNPPRAPSPSDSPDDKTAPRSSPQQSRSPNTDPSAHACQTDEVPTTDPDGTLPAPSPNTDASTLSTSQTKSLPPLRTHSLPPPLPSGHALLSVSLPTINADTISSPTSTSSFCTSNSEGDAEDEAASQTNTPDTLADSFLDVLSPAPTHVISRRRSMRAHDLFAASHISFADLGSIVAPQNAPE